MLFCLCTDQGSSRCADQADSCSANLCREASCFTIENLLGCGYVGNMDVVHISTAWACGPCG